MDSNGTLNPEPIAILQDRTYQLRSRTITQVLVQWQGESQEDATWENICFGNNSLTFWARCFNGGGIVRIIDCIVLLMQARN